MSGLRRAHGGQSLQLDAHLTHYLELPGGISEGSLFLACTLKCSLGEKGGALSGREPSQAWAGGMCTAAQGGGWCKDSRGMQGGEVCGTRPHCPDSHGCTLPPALGPCAAGRG